MNHMTTHGELKAAQTMFFCVVTIIRTHLCPKLNK
jgi:hypothetical protein